MCGVEILVYYKLGSSIGCKILPRVRTIEHFSISKYPPLHKPSRDFIVATVKFIIILISLENSSGKEFGNIDFDVEINVAD